MATPFTFEAVANDIAVGSGEVCLALDKTGNPSIAFSQAGSGQIVVARRNAGTWTHENVPGGFVGDGVRPGLAMDSLGNPRLGYQDLGSGELIHAIKSAGQWSFTHISTKLTPIQGPGGVAGVAFALHPGRLDTESRDVGFFAYTDLATDGIGFAHTGSIGPTPVTVQLAPNGLTSFADVSVSFDSSENFFVGYASFFHTGAPQDFVSVLETFVVDIEQGTFATPTVIEGSPFINVRRPTSIARTATDGCLAYFDMAGKTLKAFVASGGIARIETIAANVNNIVTPSAAAKGNDFRVAYADADAIKLASRDRFGDWTIEAVDAVSGGTPSLAYDNAGTANIAYVAGGKLKYGRRSE
jgi:hypothetical protein